MTRSREIDGKLLRRISVSAILAILLLVTARPIDHHKVVHVQLFIVLPFFPLLDVALLIALNILVGLLVALARDGVQEFLQEVPEEST